MPTAKRTTNNVLRDLAANSLAAYAAAISTKFELATHHRLIIEELERIERGQSDRLLIMMPPRHGKSELASRIFPAWFLGRNPGQSVITAAYGAELATDFGRIVRGHVNSPVHRAVFPGCVAADDSNSVQRFATTAGGAYFAVGCGGALTGRGADLLLIDDPVKGAEEARSATMRRGLQQWYESVAYTRLQPGGAVVVIATRWHESDLVGWLQKEHASENWRVLCLPAIAETDEGWRKEGEALWPTHFGLEALQRTREAIGSAAWTSLYQQRPTALGGGVFKSEWWQRWTDAPEKAHRVVFSIDSAFKTGEQNDYSVVQIWCETDAGYYLIRQWRERAEFPELERQVKFMAELWKPHAVLIEDKASGQSLIQSLKADTKLPVLPIKVSTDKVSRAHAVTPLIESGRVWIPAQADWLSDFEDEIAAFPNGSHDDSVDATTQALSYLYGAGGVSVQQIISVNENARRLTREAEQRKAQLAALQPEARLLLDPGRARPTPSWLEPICDGCGEIIKANRDSWTRISIPFKASVTVHTHCASKVQT